MNYIKTLEDFKTTRFKSKFLNDYKKSIIDAFINFNGSILNKTFNKSKHSYLFKYYAEYKTFIKTHNNYEWQSFIINKYFPNKNEIFTRHTFISKLNNVLIHHSGYNNNSIWLSQEFNGKNIKDIIPSEDSGDDGNLLKGKGLTYGFLLSDILDHQPDIDDLNIYGEDDTSCIITYVKEAMYLYSSIGDVVEVLFDAANAKYEKLYVYVNDNDKFVIRFANKEEKQFNSFKETYTFIKKYF